MDSFHTEGGLRVPAVTAQQMREVDGVAVAEIGPNLHQMWRTPVEAWPRSA